MCAIIFVFQSLIGRLVKLAGLQCILTGSLYENGHWCAIFYVCQSLTGLSVRLGEITLKKFANRLFYFSKTCYYFSHLLANINLAYKENDLRGRIDDAVGLLNNSEMVIRVCYSCFMKKYFVYIFILLFVFTVASRNDEFGSTEYGRSPERVRRENSAMYVYNSSY